MYLYGKNSIKERLKKNPQTIKKIWMRDHVATSSLGQDIKEKGISFSIGSEKDISRYLPGKKNQGIVALVNDFVYQSLDNILDTNDLPLLIFLDKVQDPQNLGSIMRTLACLGHFVLCLSKHSSCLVNQTVLHVASGAENYLPVVQVSNIINAIIKIKKKGYLTVGTVAEKSHILERDTFSFPLALVLGSEGSGIGTAIRKHLDYLVHIPMKGANLSLNVSIATAIIAYEAMLQNRKEK